MTTTINLITGELKITSNTDLEPYCGFASRYNKKRGFLFLSKVLGKHYPSCPYRMREIHEQLALLIKPKLKEGPTVVIGFSETATSLGYGVYEALDLPNSYYQHSTRHQINKPVFINFSESHSHATNHYLYYPENIKHHKILMNASNIVFIDDEFTTGQTVKGLIRELKGKINNPFFIAASILDWTEKKETDPLPEIVSLVKGQINFRSKNYTKSIQNVSETSIPHIHHNLSNLYGRVGCEKLSIDFHNLLNTLPKNNDKVLVIGTGEFMNVSYKLALFLKSFSDNVLVQSTTRSPILIGNDVHSYLSFKDNYGENVDNFIYNFKENYDKIYICYETSELPYNHNLHDQLKHFFSDINVLYF
jgi:hypothetical protein